MDKLVIQAKTVGPVKNPNCKFDKYIILIICIFLPILAMGQNRISYSYDSADNRTGRAPEQQVASSQGQLVTSQQALFPCLNPKFTERGIPVWMGMQEGKPRAAGRFWFTERTDMPWRAVYAGFARSANFGLEHVKPDFTPADQIHQNNR